MKLITSLFDYARYNVDELKLKLAIRMADKVHEKTGKRYFVMPDDKDKLIIMHRPSFRKLKQSGRISYAAKVNDLKRESFYFTPYSLETKTSKNHSRISDFCKTEVEPITSSIRESKRIMFHRYMKESRLNRKDKYRLPFLVRLKIRFRLLFIQCKMELQ